MITNKQGTFRPFATPLCVYPPPFLAIHHWVRVRRWAGLGADDLTDECVNNEPSNVSSVSDMSSSSEHMLSTFTNISVTILTHTHTDTHTQPCYTTTLHTQTLLLLQLQPFNGQFFQDNLGEPVPERQNQSGFY